MMKWHFVMVYTLLGISLTACGGNQESLPTLVPVENEMASPTPEMLLEASLTPTIQASDTPTFAPRATLPPTWTPTATWTPTETPTVFVPTSTPFVPRNTLPASCGQFDVVFADSTIEFPIGSTPRIAWVGIEGAELYRVILTGPRGIVNDQIYLSETSYSFDASLFRVGDIYGWEVYPIDAAGIQMCFSVGMELIPRQPLSPGG